MFWLLIVTESKGLLNSARPKRSGLYYVGWWLICGKFSQTSKEASTLRHRFTGSVQQHQTPNNYYIRWSQGSCSWWSCWCRPPRPPTASLVRSQSLPGWKSSSLVSFYFYLPPSYSFNQTLGCSSLMLAPIFTTVWPSLTRGTQSGARSSSRWWLSLWLCGMLALL